MDQKPVILEVTDCAIKKKTFDREINMTMHLTVSEFHDWICVIISNFIYSNSFSLCETLFIYCLFNTQIDK